MTDILDETNVTVELESFEPDLLITHPSRTVDQFRQWLREKRESNLAEYEDTTVQFNPEHNWSHYKARQNFAKAKDVDRHFWNSYDEFTTVLITRTADDNTGPLLEQTQALTSKSYYQSRYRLLRDRGSSEDYAAVSVYAPKYPTHADRTVRTHIHTGLWLPGHVEPEAFDLLKDKHMATVEGATGCHITVRHHSSDSYPPAENGIDSTRGATTSLPYELAGENQPLMNTETDASDLYDERCLEWCATFSAGDDGSHDTPGMSYWRELGSFREYADRVENSMRRQVERDLRRSRLPHRTERCGTNQMDSLPPEAESSPLRISKPTRESLFRAVSQLAQIPTPDRRLETPIDGRLKTSKGIFRGS
ncbi:hypothetical protein [Haloarcula rara]|uniref:hypothetical protein n=1 Tax=Haloarcula rara TaxID=3033387 RepID=UPI0023E892FA|nr:hypothetical protein [Halomicroarcula sp. SHR3]